MLRCLIALMVIFFPPTDFYLEFSSLQLVPIAFHLFTAHIQEVSLDLLQMNSERQGCDPPSPCLSLHGTEHSQLSHSLLVHP